MVLDHPVSERVARWIEQAENLGLTVTVEHKNDGVIEGVTLDIERPKVEEKNMLDVVHNQARLWIYSCRTYGTGRWSHSARKHGYAVNSYDVKISTVRYTIAGIAE